MFKNMFYKIIFLAISLSYCLMVIANGCYQEGQLDMPSSSNGLKITPTENGTYGVNMDCSWNISIEYPPGKVVKLTTNITEVKNYQLNYDQEILLTISNCHRYRRNITFLDFRTNDTIPYFFSENNLCLHFKSPASLSNPNSTFWSVDLTFVDAPTNTNIPMVDHVNVVDYYFGNFSTITFESTNLGLQLYSQYLWKRNYPNSGLIYIYASNYLKNLYAIADGNGNFVTYINDDKHNAFTILYVGEPYDDSMLLGWAMAVEREVYKNCNGSIMAATPQVSVDNGIFTSHNDTCNGVLYISSYYNYYINSINYTTNTGTVSITGKDGLNRVYPIMEFDQNNYKNVPSYILGKGLYRISLPPFSSLDLGSFNEKDDVINFTQPFNGVLSAYKNRLDYNFLCESCIANWTFEAYNLDEEPNSFLKIFYDGGNSTTFGLNKINDTITIKSTTSLNFSSSVGANYWIKYSASIIEYLTTTTTTLPTTTEIRSESTTSKNSGTDFTFSHCILYVILIFINF